MKYPGILIAYSNRCLKNMAYLVVKRLLMNPLKRQNEKKVTNGLVIAIQLSIGFEEEMDISTFDM